MEVILQLVLKLLIARLSFFPFMWPYIVDLVLTFIQKYDEELFHMLSCIFLILVVIAYRLILTFSIQFMFIQSKNRTF